MVGYIYLTQPAASRCKPDEMAFDYIRQFKYFYLCTRSIEAGVEISDAFVNDKFMERIHPLSTKNLLNVN